MDNAVPNDTIKTLTYRSGRWQENETAIISEKPVSLSVNGDIWLTFMCTPDKLEALAVGFLYNEEVIQRKEDIASVRVCPEGDNIDVWLNLTVNKPENWFRTSGCSGGETAVPKMSARKSIPKANLDQLLSAEQISNLMHQLSEAQELYKKSGGVHTSAISDGKRILLAAEDIGRHNTLDKLAGLCIIDDIRPAHVIILTTGRVSSEMIQKSWRMGGVVVISRTSPSSLSAQMAEELGITLIGYARIDQFTIYAHPERVLSGKTSENNRREAE